MTEEHMNNTTELVMLLDRSGSMAGLESDTIGGFNSMIEKQREKGGEVLVSTVLFDNEAKVLHDRIPIAEIQTLTRKDYYTRGSTALFDAVGLGIDHIGHIHKKLGSKAPGKTLFIITTDGYENSSSRYSQQEIKKMISNQKEKYHWEFIFVGTDIDAVLEASKLGIRSERAFYSKRGSKEVRDTYDMVGECIDYCYAEMSDEQYEESITKVLNRYKKH